MAIVTINRVNQSKVRWRRFKRKVMTEEIIKDAKKHAVFIPPGQKQNSSQLLRASETQKRAHAHYAPRLTGLAPSFAPALECVSPAGSE